MTVIAGGVTTANRPHCAMKSRRDFDEALGSSTELSSMVQSLTAYLSSQCGNRILKKLLMIASQINLYRIYINNARVSCI